MCGEYMCGKCIYIYIYIYMCGKFRYVADIYRCGKYVYIYIQWETVMILKKTTMISQARKPRKHKQNTGRTTKTTENNTNTKI